MVKLGRYHFMLVAYGRGERKTRFFITRAEAHAVLIDMTDAGYDCIITTLGPVVETKPSVVSQNAMFNPSERWTQLM
jgi:hypothetical protein